LYSSYKPGIGNATGNYTDKEYIVGSVRMPYLIAGNIEYFGIYKADAVLVIE
jgi:hypothetical protein